MAVRPSVLYIYPLYRKASKKARETAEEAASFAMRWWYSMHLIGDAAHIASLHPNSFIQFAQTWYNKHRKPGIKYPHFQKKSQAKTENEIKIVKNTAKTINLIEIQNLSKGNTEKTLYKTGAKRYKKGSLQHPFPPFRAYNKFATHNRICNKIDTRGTRRPHPYVQFQRVSPSHILRHLPSQPLDNPLLQPRDIRLRNPHQIRHLLLRPLLHTAETKAHHNDLPFPLR